MGGKNKQVIAVQAWYCDGVKARSRSGQRHVVSVAKVTGEIERDP